MPRNVKESDEDVETKGGRRTRASVNSSVLDSPLRRSTRIKHPTAQDVSSPESVSDASTVTTTRTTRRRTATGDTVIPEGGRNLRVRRNSVASDISELTETESLPDGPPKRITRRSVAGVPAAETPTKLNGRPRRTTRAGSETKSTPPVARATRKTRASSMEPETIEEQNIRQIDTPVKSRKRASVMPSEPAVVEESDDGKSIEVRKSKEKTVYEVDENDSETSPQNIATSLRQKPKDDANESDEKMEVDPSPVKGSEADSIDRSVPDIVEATTDTSAKHEDSTIIADKFDKSVTIDETSEEQKISSPSKGSSHSIENIVTNSIEKQEKSPGNKENEVFNIGVDAIEKDVKFANNDVRPFNRKAFYTNLFKVTDQRRRISSDDELLVDRCESKTPTTTEEIVASEPEKRPLETMLRKEYFVDKCVVVIEPMDINQVDKAVVVAQASVMSDAPKTGDDIIPKVDTSPALVEHAEKHIDTPDPLIVENNDVPTTNEDIIDGDSNLKISNVMSISVNEEKSDKENETVEENDTNINKSNEPIETIDLEASVAEKVEETIVLEASVEEKVEETSLKVTSEGFAGDETCKKRLINTADTIDSQSSINNEKSQEIEENIVCEMVKETSSIVTESPENGTNVEEASGLSEEQNKDKSASADDSSEVLQKDDEAESLPKKKSASESKVLETDNESDCSGYPAFKDITADEWTKADNEQMKKHNEDETNSVHSASTERNESECEIELVDKESVISVDKRMELKRDAKLDYDTDDTVITQINPVTDPSEENEVTTEETPMDLSSDLDEDEEGASNSPKKRLSSSNKNESPGLSNVSRRKSFLDTDDESTTLDSPMNNEANISVKSKKTPSKSPKKRISSAAGRPKIDDSSESDDTENSVSKTPKTGPTPNRKSFDASAKKLDTSKNSFSAKNTPLKDEIKDSETPAKRKSSNKFASVYSFNDSDEISPSRHLDRSQMSTESGMAQSTQSEVDDEELSLKIAPAVPQDAEEQNNKSVTPGSAKKFGANRSSCEDGDLTPDSDIDGEQLDKSAKQRSAKKAAANKSASRVSELESDSELHDVLDEPTKRASAKKSSIEKGNWKMTPISMGSPNVFIEETLNESTKSTGSRKSINKNSSMIVRSMQLDSDSEVDAEQELSAKVSKSKLESEQSKLNASKLLALVDSDSESDVKVSKKTPSSGKIVSQSNSNASKLLALVDSDSESDVKVLKKTPLSAKIVSQDKLNKSAKSASAKKLSIGKNSSKIAQNNSDFEADEDEELQQKPTKSIIERASKFFIDVDKNYSTIAQVNSDSEAIESSSSDEAGDTSLIPQFFFDRETTSSSNSSAENDDSSDTIDSDVANDLNLHGKSTIEYSDDDVPADDCMATESESSDSDDDGADLVDFVVDDDDEDSFGEEQSNDSFGNVNEKIRKRIITNLDSDSDSDNNVEPLASNHEFDKSATGKTPKKDKKLNKSKSNSEFVENGDFPATNDKSDLDKSVTAKTPKKDKKLNKTQEVAEPEIQSTELNVSAKIAAKKNKNLLIQSSTPKGAIRQVSSLKKDDTPKSATPLSRSLKNADSPMKNEAGATSSAKKLSKSVCETIETPTKLGSSFKVTKTPKTPKTPATVGQQLQTSLPIDLMDSASKINLSKTKTTKISTLNQTMLTPNTDTSETRFLMKEKLNDSLPALKLQQKAKASRRSTLDNVCEEVAASEENSAIFDEEIEQPTEKNVSIREEAAAVVPEVGSEKKKNKKKKAKNIDTSKDPEVESFAMPKDIERTLNEDESTECLENDASNNISKKRNKKKKISETETQEPTVSKTEETSTKNKKKKKLEENIEEVQVNATNTKDKKKKKRVEAVDAVDESHNDEIIKKNTKKNKKREESVEVAAAPISKKNKKRDEPVEVAAAPISKKNKKRDESVEVAAAPISKKNKNRDEPAEDSTAPILKKKLRVAEKNVASDADDATNLTELRDATLGDRKKQTKKKQLERSSMKTRSVTSSGVESLKTNLKRLSDEILESLSETPERPKKRRKIAKTEKIVPSRTMFDSRHQPPTSLNVDDGYISLSASGGTTQFQVVSLKKTTKKSKNTVAALSFRERMLARNPRQPISAYLMYQQKQKASGKDRPY